MEQGSPEWFAARLGKVTGSRIADVLSTGTGRETYMAQLVVERITGKPIEMYSNSAMQWGTETEPLARASYEIKKGVFVDEVGSIPHPSIPMAAASPDGLVGDDGLVEIKCPNTSTHIDTLLGAKIKTGYLYQMQFQMACTGRKWCDFVSFDPRMEERLQLHIRHVPYDQTSVTKIEDGIRKFLTELDEKIKKLTELKVNNG